jgi:hypothetical protein
MICTDVVKLNLNLRGPKFFCMQLISKVCFFYSGELCTRFTRAANFPSRKKKTITLLTCYINNCF